MAEYTRRVREETGVKSPRRDREETGVSTGLLSQSNIVHFCSTMADCTQLPLTQIEDSENGGPLAAADGSTAPESTTPSEAGGAGSATSTATTAVGSDGGAAKAKTPRKRAPKKKTPDAPAAKRAKKGAGASGRDGNGVNVVRLPTKVIAISEVEAARFKTQLRADPSSGLTFLNTFVLDSGKPHQVHLSLGRVYAFPAANEWGHSATLSIQHDKLDLSDVTKKRLAKLKAVDAGLAKKISGAVCLDGATLKWRSMLSTYTHPTTKETSVKLAFVKLGRGCAELPEAGAYLVWLSLLGAWYKPETQEAGPVIRIVRAERVKEAKEGDGDGASEEAGSEVE